MEKGLKQYLTVENPHICQFNGKGPDGRYSMKGLIWIMRETLLPKSSIGLDNNMLMSTTLCCKNIIVLIMGILNHPFCRDWELSPKSNKIIRKRVKPADWEPINK